MIYFQLQHPTKKIKNTNILISHSSYSSLFRKNSFFKSTFFILKWCGSRIKGHTWRCISSSLGWWRILILHLDVKGRLPAIRKDHELRGICYASWLPRCKTSGGYIYRLIAITPEKIFRNQFFSVLNHRFSLNTTAHILKVDCSDLFFGI